MASYLDAVFAYFGDDEPTEELRSVLFERTEPTDEELEEILGSNDGSTDGKTYCQRVHDTLLSFCAYPAIYVAGLSDDNPRKLGLAVIAEIHSISKAVVQRALVEKQEPVPKPAENPIAGVDPMLSGVVRVAQPPRTTPVRTTSAVDKPADGPPEGGHGGDNDMRRDFKEQQKKLMLSSEDTIEFMADPKRFLSRYPEGSPERETLLNTLKEIKARRASNAKVDPITREMREAVKGKQWQGIYGALLNAYLIDDSDKKVLAGQLCNSYLHGVYGVNGRVLGALMRQCMQDLEAKLNISDPNEFVRRYVG